MSEHRGVLRVASTEEPAWWPRPDRRSEREPGDDARRARRGAGRARPRRRPRQGRAHLRGALHRRRRLRGDLPPDRSALHARSRRARTASGGGRAEDPRLLRLPAPDRRRPAPRRGPGRRPNAGPRSARSSRCSTYPSSSARGGLRHLHGRGRLELGRRVRPPRLSLVGSLEARGPAGPLICLHGRGHAAVQRRHRLRRGARHRASASAAAQCTMPTATTGPGRSSGPWWWAGACSRCRSSVSR